MIIPKEVKIGARIYTVEEVDGDELDDACGDLSEPLQRIRIRAGMKQPAKELTFIHEVLHAMNDQVEETDIGFWASAIHQFLIENKL